MPQPRVCFWLLGILLAPPSQARDTPAIQVREAFVELHTAPGEAHFVYEVAQRGETLQVIKSKGGWYKVRTSEGKLGWVSGQQLRSSLASTSDTSESASPAPN